MRYAGFVESGDVNSSQSIDEIVSSSQRPLPQNVRKKKGPPINTD